jgi:hypothetical protein
MTKNYSVLKNVAQNEGPSQESINAILLFSELYKTENSLIHFQKIILTN